MLMSKEDLAAASGTERFTSLPVPSGVTALAPLSAPLENCPARGAREWSLSPGLHRAASVSLMWPVVGRAGVWMNPKILLVTSGGQGASGQSRARVQLSGTRVIPEPRCPCVLLQGGTSAGLLI